MTRGAKKVKNFVIDKTNDLSKVLQLMFYEVFLQYIKFYMVPNKTFL